MATTLETAAEVYRPDENFNPARLELLEATMGPLIDRHLKWVPVNESPTVGIVDKDYGHRPSQYGDYDTSVSLRPKREPIDFRALSGAVLGMDHEDPSFEERVREIDGFYDFEEGKLIGDGWYAFQVREGLITPVEALAQKKISEEGFKVSSLTEDNDPTYELVTAGTFIRAGLNAGIATPAIVEWYGGLWIAEEDKHKDGQRDYGGIMRITTSDLHRLAQNSQMRTGTGATELTPTHLVIYTSWQELATKVFHGRNATMFGPVGNQLQVEEAGDEARHFDIYVSLLKALYEDERFTEEVVMLMYKEYGKIPMPGEDGIPRYLERSVKLSRAHIFSEQQRRESVRVVLDRIGALKKDDEGAYVNPKGMSTMAQAALYAMREKYDIADMSEHAPAIGNVTKFVLGQTATITDLNQTRRRYKEYKGLLVPRAA